MLDPVRPAFSRAHSIDWGTLRTAKRKTSLPFILMHEKDDCLGGKSKTEPFESKFFSDSVLLLGAFKCLHDSKDIA